MKQTRKKLVIGVDIGGTHFRTGVVETSTRRVLGLTKAKTSELTLDILCLLLSNTVPSTKARSAV